MPKYLGQQHIEQTLKILEKNKTELMHILDRNTHTMSLSVEDKFAIATLASALNAANDPTKQQLVSIKTTTIFIQLKIPNDIKTLEITTKVENHGR